MTILHNLFPTPILQVPATIENYDPVQLEIQAAWKLAENDPFPNLKDLLGFVYRSN